MTSIRKSWKLVLAIVLLCFSFANTAKSDELETLKKSADQAVTLQKGAKAALDGAQQRVGSAEQSLLRLRSELRQAEGVVKDGDKNLKAKQEAVKKPQADKAAADKALAAANAALAAEQKVIAEAEKGAKAANQTLVVATQATTETAKAEAAAAKALAEAQKALAAAKVAAEAAKKKAAEAKQVADTSKAKVEAEKKKLPELQKKVAEAKTKSDASAKALAAASTDLKTFETTLNTAKTTVAKQPAAIKAAETELESLSTVAEQADRVYAAATEFAVTQQRFHQRAMINAGKLVSFSESIAPIFAKRCVACHNARTAKGRYNMENFAAIMKGGESGHVIDPGDGEFSMLQTMLEDGSMPKDADPLTKDEIALVKKWIDTGAVLDAGIDAGSPLIAIMPKLPQPAAPDAYRVPIPVTAIAFSPDGKTLATSGYHEVVLWNAEDGARTARITNIAERVYDIEFSADGKLMAVAAGTPAQIGEAKLFEVPSGQLVADFVRTDDSVFSVAFSPDMKQLATSGADRSVRVFDIASKKELLAVEDHADWVMDVNWSPDGTKLASASRDKTSKVFDVKTGDSLVTFNSHGQPVYSVGFTPDGKQVVSAGADRNLRVWNVADAKQVRAIGGFGSEIFRIQVTPDGRVFSCSADKSARVHTIADGKAVRTFSGHADWVYSIAFNAGVKKVAAGAYDGRVRVWNLDDGKQLVEFTAAPGFEKK